MSKKVSYGLIIIIIMALAIIPQTRSDAGFRLISDHDIGSSARYKIRGIASWYSQSSPGIRKHTANNEVFDDRAMTCAMWGAAFDQQLRVTNLENGLSVIVRVNDRGPHPRFFRQGRIIDLTEAAFSRLAPTHQGLIPIQIEYL